MANNKLYPNLDHFYKSGNIEYGAKLETDLLFGVPDHKLYRKNANDINQINNKNSPKTPEEDYKKDTKLPLTPTAPPPSEGGRSLLESLHSYIMEGLEPPPYSPHDPLSDAHSWVDDLQPDYDLSLEDEEELQQINSLTDFANAVGHLDQLEPRHSGNEETTIHPSVDLTNNKDNGGARDMVIVRNRDLEVSDDPQEQSKNNEYNAWVTWRKNVNRQLATVILLKRGGHVHLQKADLSRRPLSRTSIDYVISNARNKNTRKGNAVTTSLNGTPYIMYGIPRVVLSKSPPKRN